MGNLFAVLFDERQHVVKISTAAYVSVFYEIINLFIKPQNFLLVFFICKRQGFYLIVTASEGLLMFILFVNCRQT